MSPGSGEALQATFQATLPPAADAPCPSAERIWSTAFGELTREQAGPVVLHSARCAQCGAALRIALELGAEAMPSALPRRVPRVGRMAMAMGVAAAIAATVVLLPRHHPSEPVVHERGGDAAGIRSLLPATPRPRSGMVLEWSPYPGALRYQVTLASMDLRVLFQKVGVKGTRVEVPESALAGVPSGTRLTWHVEAVLPDGRTVESPGFDLLLE